MITNFSNIHEIINDAKLGKPFILLDDADRENEGDIVLAAQYTTPEMINFMIKYCRGLVCVAIDSIIAKRFNLDLQIKHNNTTDSTAFTISIDAIDGITTGISVYDRAVTINLLASKDKNYKHIRTPGHIFPLIANKDGVLKRRGHTEASLEIMKLAGLELAAVICEILNDDGSMSRLGDLMQFANLHNIKIFTIKQLIEHINNI